MLLRTRTTSPLPLQVWLQLLARVWQQVRLAPEGNRTPPRMRAWVRVMETPAMANGWSAGLRLVMARLVAELMVAELMVAGRLVAERLVESGEETC